MAEPNNINVIEDQTEKGEPTLPSETGEQGSRQQELERLREEQIVSERLRELNEKRIRDAEALWAKAKDAARAKAAARTKRLRKFSKDPVPTTLSRTLKNNRPLSILRKPNDNALALVPSTQVLEQASQIVPAQPIVNDMEPLPVAVPVREEIVPLQSRYKLPQPIRSMEPEDTNKPSAPAPLLGTESMPLPSEDVQKPISVSPEPESVPLPQGPGLPPPIREIPPGPVPLPGPESAPLHPPIREVPELPPVSQTADSQGWIDPSVRNLTKPPVQIVTRIFPTPYVNSKGYRIGDFHTILDQEKLPFHTHDQVDSFLHNLNEYVSYEGTPQNSRKIKKTIRDFFKSEEVRLTAFQPINYPNPAEAEHLKRQEDILRIENKRLRENLKKLNRDLLELTGKVEDTQLRKDIIDEIEKRLKTSDDINRKREVLAAYLGAIEDEEDLLEDGKMHKKFGGSASENINEEKPWKKRDGTVRKRSKRARHTYRMKHARARK
jgi:hypothetical protein